METYLLIDCENIQPEYLDVGEILKGKENVFMTLFTTKSCPIQGAGEMGLIPEGDTGYIPWVETFYLKRDGKGDQNVDKAIMMRLGELATQHKKREVIILSNDKGYIQFAESINNRYKMTKVAVIRDSRPEPLSSEEIKAVPSGARLKLLSKACFVKRLNYFGVDTKYHENMAGLLMKYQKGKYDEAVFREKCCGICSTPMKEKVLNALDMEKEVAV